MTPNEREADLPDWMQQSMDRLSPLQREIFLEFRVERLRYPEIAERNGISVRKVKKQLAEALFQLVCAKKGVTPTPGWRCLWQWLTGR